MTEPKLCPVGKFCVSGSQTGEKCQPGYYNPVLGGDVEADYCLDCPPGRVCSGKGLSAPDGDCAAGFFCLSKAITQRPSALDPNGNFGKCPVGHYCPEATAYPYPCPAGTFRSTEQGEEVGDCTSCTAGSYCLTRGLTQVTGQCDAGFYCPAGQIEPRNDQYKCPTGKFCPTGTASLTNQDCAGGTYQHLEYQDSCNNCPPGYFCPTGAVTPTICPVGNFCVQNSASASECTYGKYMPDTGATACIDCPPGKACPSNGIDTLSVNCAAGYYCQGAAQTATPVASAQGGFICPVGSYCPEGSAFKRLCLPGYACPNEGMADTDLTGDTYKCDAGYYCTIGATTKTPTLGNEGGGVCSAGHYCP